MSRLMEKKLFLVRRLLRAMKRRSPSLFFSRQMAVLVLFPLTSSDGAKGVFSFSDKDRHSFLNISSGDGFLKTANLSTTGGAIGFDSPTVFSQGVSSTSPVQITKNGTLLSVGQFSFSSGATTFNTISIFVGKRRNYDIHND